MSDSAPTSDGSSESHSEDEPNDADPGEVHVREELCDSNYNFYKLSAINIANSIITEDNLHSLALTPEGYTSWKDLDSRWGLLKKTVFYSDTEVIVVIRK